MTTPLLQRSLELLEARSDAQRKAIFARMKGKKGGLAGSPGLVAKRIPGMYPNVNKKTGEDFTPNEVKLKSGLMVRSHFGGGREKTWLPKSAVEKLNTRGSKLRKMVADAVRQSRKSKKGTSKRVGDVKVDPFYGKGVVDIKTRSHYV